MKEATSASCFGQSWKLRKLRARITGEQSVDLKRSRNSSIQPHKYSSQSVSNQMSLASRSLVLMPYSVRLSSESSWI